MKSPTVQAEENLGQTVFSQDNLFETEAIPCEAIAQDVDPLNEASLISIVKDEHLSEVSSETELIGTLPITISEVEFTQNGSRSSGTEDAVSPESEDNVPPEPEDAVSPESEDNVHSEPEDAVSPESEDNVHSEPEDVVSPESEDNVPPEPEDVVSPESEDNVSPEPEDVVSPESEDNVPPEPEEAVSPESEDNVPSELEEIVSPASEDIVSPELEDAVSPESEDTVSPEPEEAVSPVSKNIFLLPSEKDENAVNLEVPMLASKDRSATRDESDLFITLITAKSLNDGKIEIHWYPSAIADGFYLFYKRSNTAPEVYVRACVGTATIHQPDGPGEKFYRVLPYRRDPNTGKISRGVLSPYVSACAKPKPVQYLRSQRWQDHIKLEWQPAEGATDYIIYRQTEWADHMSYLYLTTKTQFVDFNAHGGFNFYRVYPRYKSDSCTGSSDRYTYSYRLPEHIKNLALHSYASGNVVVDWQAVEGADAYKVYRRDALSQAPIKVYQTTAFRFIDTYSRPGIATYWVVPVLKIGKKELSRPLKSNLGRTTIVIPKAVTNLTVNNSGRWSKRINWNAQSGVTKYVIYSATPDFKSFSYRTLVTKKQFYDRLLYPGTYLYKVFPVLTISNKDYWGQSKTYAYGIVKPIADVEYLNNIEDFNHLGRAMIRELRSHVEVVYYAPWIQDIEAFHDACEAAVWTQYSDQLANQLPTMAELEQWEWSYERYGDYLYLDLDHGYYATPEQYQLVLQDADRVARQARKNYKTDYERLKYGFDYVIDSFEYAYDIFGEVADYSPSGISTQSAYSAYIDRETICNGYASYLMAIYQKMGYRVYYVYTLNYLYNPDEPDLDEHAWLMVQVNGQWYHVDPTWGDTLRPQCYDYYFLKSADNMRNNDFSEDYYDGIRDEKMHIMHEYLPPAPTDYIA
ncbi:MAG: transglutaminase domain-containing protein [Fastidiosipilaceae bacterium]